MKLELINYDVGTLRFRGEGKHGPYYLEIDLELLAMAHRAGQLKEFVAGEITRASEEYEHT